MNDTPPEPAASELPMVVPAGEIETIPVQVPWFRSPWPGWWGACFTTFGYWFVMLMVMGVVVGLALVAMLLLGNAGGGLPALGGQNLPDIVHLALTLSMLLAYIGGLVYSIVALRLTCGRGWARQIGLQRLPVHAVALALLALPGFICASDILATTISEFIEAICLALGLGKPPTIQTDLAQQFSPYHWSLTVLIVGIAPGVAEEFWCRGFLSRGLVGRYGVVVGVLMTSTLFGLLHLWPPAYVITTGLMGMALHFTYLMSRSLWVPILIHTLNNSFAGLGEMKILNAEPLSLALQQQTYLLAVLSISLLVFAGYALWTSRGRIVDAEGNEAEAADLGVIVPPRGSGLTIAHSHPNPLAVLFAAIAWGLILFVILR